RADDALVADVLDIAARFQRAEPPGVHGEQRIRALRTVLAARRIGKHAAIEAMVRVVLIRQLAGVGDAVTLAVLVTEAEERMIRGGDHRLRPVLRVDGAVEKQPVLDEATADADAIID